MKHLKYTIVFFFGILLFNITSCDIVEGPYLIDGNTNPVDTNTFVKKVLIEDFYLVRKHKKGLPSGYSYECKDCTVKRVTASRKNKKKNSEKLQSILN